MSAFSSGTRSAVAALAAIFACSVTAIPVAIAQSSATTEQNASEDGSEPAVPKAASEVGDAAKPAEAAKDVATAPAEPTTEGAPSVSDFKEPEPAKDEPAAAAAPATPTDPLGKAVLARLTDSSPLLPRLPAKQREAMQGFYALGNDKPVWIVDGNFTPAAKSVIERLGAAGEDGLDAAAYPIPTLPAAGKSASETDIADADVRLSAAALLYARDARGGRINLSNISKLVTPALDLPSADALLPELTAAGDQAGTKLQAYNPRTPGYLALKRRLAGLRGPAPQASTATPSLNLPVGPVLKVGMSDPRVPKLREFFGLPNRTPGTLDAAPGESDAYDKDVADAVAKFQRSRDLPDNGNLTRATIVALATRKQPSASGHGGAGEAELLVNMERWRWLPGELGSDYVLVNVPEYRLRVFRGGVIRDETRVIVGKTESPTPLFSGAMEYAVVNPSWFVPPSILKTMLASGRTGGFEVIRRHGQVSLRQPPGERNALGFIKFLFPNQHSVYLHDTPNRSLFSASKRAMSHGCVRVDDPFRFGDAVLPEEWTTEKLKKLIGKGERTIKLPQKLPVHLAYFTAYVDDSGIYRTLPDIYGYDAKMKATLGLSTEPAAVANRPTEPGRVAAAMVHAPAQPNGQGAAARQPTRRTAAAPAPHRQAQPPQYRQAQAVQRVRREPAYGEPGLWTPPPQPSQPRGWW